MQRFALGAKCGGFGVGGKDFFESRACRRGQDAGSIFTGRDRGGRFFEQQAIEADSPPGDDLSRALVKLDDRLRGETIRHQPRALHGRSLPHEGLAAGPFHIHAEIQFLIAQGDLVRQPHAAAADHQGPPAAHFAAACQPVGIGGQQRLQECLLVAGVALLARKQPKQLVATPQDILGRAAVERAELTVGPARLFELLQGMNAVEHIAAALGARDASLTRLTEHQPAGAPREPRSNRRWMPKSRYASGGGA